MQLDKSGYNFSCKVLMAAVLLSSPGALAQSQAAKGLVQRLGETTHIEFSGLSQWNYDLKPEGKKITLLVPVFDAQTVGELKAWSDPHVTAVDVDTNGPDGRYIVTFHLAATDVEVFDYQTDEPSRLILDFYKKAEPEKTATPTQTTLQENKTVEEKKPAIAVAENVKKPEMQKADNDYKKVKSPSRKPAGDEFLSGPINKPPKEGSDDKEQLPLAGVFDAADKNFERFRLQPYQVKEESIIASQKNIYLRFPMLQLNASKLIEIANNKVEYSLEPNEQEENKQVRLMQTLKEKKRSGAFLKVYDFFTYKYPESQYMEIVKNMAIDVFLEKWLSERKHYDYEKIKELVKELRQKWPKSPLSERNLLLLSYLDLDRKDALGVLQNFQQFINDFPESGEVDFAKRAMAEAYLMMGKYDDALKIYNDLSVSARERNLAVEAEYRKGDVYFADKKFAEAVKAYKTAIEKFPFSEKVFPNALFNMAEAQFWLGNHKTLESLNGYIRFLDLYSDHPYGGYALTRIGELLDILGADRSQVIGAYLESYFRFRTNPGAEIARIRMLSQQMRGMRDVELKKGLEEIEKIIATSPLARASEFVTLIVAEGLFNRAEYDKALEKLITYYQKNPTSANLTLFRKNILRNMSEWMKTNMEQGKFMDVLSFNDKYKKTWLRNTDRLDVNYYIGQAYEQAGVLLEAEGRYIEVLKKLENIRGTEEYKQRRVNEHLPSEERMLLRLAAVAVQQRKYIDAFNNLAKMKDVEKLNEKEKIERAVLAADVYEQRGEPDKAVLFVKNLVDVWRGSPDLLPAAYLKLGELHSRMDKNVDAIGSIDKILTMQAQGTNVDDEIVAKSLELKGNVLVKEGKELAAVETFQALLDKYETEKTLSSVRYRSGQILFDKGDILGAEKIWSRLNPKRDGVYLRLAQEKLENAKWNADYKKYIQRIPAMSSRED